MEISELTLKIIMLFIPGAISAIIVEQLTIHKRWTSFKFVISSIILGLISYLVLQLFYMVFFNTIKALEFWQPFLKTYEIPYKEIFFASIFGVLIGFLSTYVIQKKLLFKLAQKLNVSSKYGDECLYYYFLNAKDLKEVYVRDYEHGLTYHGFIQAFSESNYERELVLNNVDVYRISDSELLYNSDALFISKPKDINWHIETVKIIDNSKIEDDAKESNQ